MPVKYGLEREFEEELASAPVIRVRYVRGRYGEFESEPGMEAFDPSPPPPGTTLLTNFPFGQATISAQHRSLISREAASAVGRMPSAPPFGYCIFIDVEGHEDEVGDPAQFRRVGAARAVAVARILTERLKQLILRLPSSSRREVRITVSTAGPARPIRSNSTAEGRALNRRVELRTRVAPCGTIV